MRELEWRVTQYIIGLSFYGGIIDASRSGISSITSIIIIKRYVRAELARPLVWPFLAVIFFLCPWRNMSGHGASTMRKPARCIMQVRNDNIN